MATYILSSGKSTDRVEDYLLDLFELYLKIYPGDVPGVPEFGFDFNLLGVMKEDLPKEIKSRVAGLVNKVNSRFSAGIKLEVVSLEIISETKARVTVQAGQSRSEVTLNIY